MTHTQPVDYEYYAQVRKDGQLRTLEVRPREMADSGVNWMVWLTLSTLGWAVVIGIGIMAYRLIRHVFS